MTMSAADIARAKDLNEAQGLDNRLLTWQAVGRTLFDAGFGPSARVQMVLERRRRSICLRGPDDGPDQLWGEFHIPVS
jgi:hypothetical protein